MYDINKSSASSCICVKPMQKWNKSDITSKCIFCDKGISPLNGVHYLADFHIKLLIDSHVMPFGISSNPIQDKKIGSINGLDEINYASWTSAIIINFTRHNPHRNLKLVDIKKSIHFANFTEELNKILDNPIVSTLIYSNYSNLCTKFIEHIKSNIIILRDHSLHGLKLHDSVNTFSLMSSIFNIGQGVIGYGVNTLNIGSQDEMHINLTNINKAFPALLTMSLSNVVPVCNRGSQVETSNLILNCVSINALSFIKTGNLKELQIQCTTDKHIAFSIGIMKPKFIKHELYEIKVKLTNPDLTQIIILLNTIRTENLTLYMSNSAFDDDEDYSMNTIKDLIISDNNKISKAKIVLFTTTNKFNPNFVARVIYKKDVIVDNCSHDFVDGIIRPSILKLCENINICHISDIDEKYLRDYYVKIIAQVRSYANPSYDVMPNNNGILIKKICN